MKKYLSLALIALTLIAACICLVSCKGDDTPLEVVLEEIDKISFKDKTVVYNGKPKNVTVTTRLQYNRLPSGIKVRYEGNGNVDVGEYEVKAIFSKDGVEIPEATKTAKLTIKKAVYDLTDSLEKFVSSTLPYNGQEQTLKVNEDRLPGGVTVTYSYPDGMPKVAGDYKITAKFTHTNDKNYEPIPDQTVTLTIEPKAFDTSGFSFNRTFTIFDGSKKTVKITGTLPEGLKVRYEPEDGVISVGEHTVRAVFYTEDENYKAPEPMVTTLTILNEDYSSSDDLTYLAITDESDNIIAYKITGYTGSANYLILPETYQGKPVTEINASAFANKKFIYVHMPDSITKLGDRVFLNCTNLKELYLSNNLTNIGIGVFQGCTGLETINLPDTITEIPNNCFSGCTSLSSIKLGSNVTTIGVRAFMNCSKLDKIHIPKSVTTVAAQATQGAHSPFFGAAANFMAVLEDIKVGDGFSQYWAHISATDTALILYNQSYEQYITGHIELRKADKTTALANNIIIGSTPLLGFDSNTFTYSTFANIYYGYPIVSIKAASPAALITIEQATEANGGKATITIVSADGADTKTYVVNFTPIGEFNSTAEVVNKNNADAVVTYVIDDGYKDTATFGKSMLLKYNSLSLSFATWTRDFATLTETEPDENGIKSYVMDDGKYVYTVDQDNVNFWKDILTGVDGRAEIMVHSHTHKPWGANDDGGEYKYVDNSGKVNTVTLPRGSVSKEYYGAKQIISDLFPQSLFPSVRNLGFITPGIGVQGSDKVVDGETIIGYKAYADQILKDCIEKNIYLGTRGTFIPTSLTDDFSNRVVTKDTINKLSTRMNLPGLAVKDYDDVKLWTNYIDQAIELGGWAMFCIHEMDDTPKNTKWWIPTEKADQLFAYTAGKNVWVATFSDAITYYIEWATASASSKYISAENKVMVTLTDGEEDNDIFNTPLTVKVTIPVIWESATDGTNDLTVYTEADGTKYVFVDVVPDKGPVYITKK